MLGYSKGSTWNVPSLPSAPQPNEHLIYCTFETVIMDTCLGSLLEDVRRQRDGRAIGRSGGSATTLVLPKTAWGHDGGKNVDGHQSNTHGESKGD